MALGLIIQSGAGANASGEPVRVETDMVRMERASATVAIPAQVFATRASALAMRISGPIARLETDIGDVVDEGAALAAIDAAPFALRVERQKAAIRRLEAARSEAEARLRLAQIEERRFRDLRGSAAYSPAEYQQRAQAVTLAEAALLGADAGLGEARADLALAELELADTVLYAPFAGVVIARHHGLGEYVTPGSAIVTLVDPASLAVEVAVPTDLRRGLEPGQVLRVRQNDQLYDAVVRALPDVSDPATGLWIVRLSPARAADSEKLRPGPAEALMPQGGNEEMLTVHKDAVVFQQGVTLVFILRDGQAHPRPVRLGPSLGARYRVLTGLADGDIAIIRGNEALVPGQPVSLEAPPDTVSR